MSFNFSFFYNLFVNRNNVSVNNDFSFSGPVNVNNSVNEPDKGILFLREENINNFSFLNKYVEKNYNNKVCKGVNFSFINNKKKVLSECNIKLGVNNKNFDIKENVISTNIINNGANDLALVEDVEVSSHGTTNNPALIVKNEMGEMDKTLSVYDLKKQLIKCKVDQVLLEVFVWNMQVLNLDNTERRKKKIFIWDLIAELTPNLIYLIDVGRLSNEINVPNYIKYVDGRNVLLKSVVIQDEILINDGIISIPSLDIFFSYVRPGEKNQDLIERVGKLIDKGCCVIGDMNLKSNDNIYKLCDNRQIVGESTLQTVMICKRNKIVECKLLPGVSDHKVVLFKMERKVKHTGAKTLVKLSNSNTVEAISQIFENAEALIDYKVKPIAKLKSVDEVSDLTIKLIGALLNNDSTIQFKIYERLWKDTKKEPFLGTYIPDKVVDSLSLHYWHNPNKVYYEIPSDLEIDISCLECKKKSFSEACCIEGFPLESIDSALQEIWEDLDSSEKKGKAIKNFFRAFNNSKDKLAYETFFLKKSKDKLDSVNDIRIISIVPIFIKIWESLIYNTVVEYVTNVVDKYGRYQFGGVLKGSTYDCLFKAREIYEKDGKGLLFIDITKGYDSIEFDILEKDIMGISEVNIRNLLRVWLIMVRNCNAKVNLSTICKSRGLGMGLSLAPSIFVLYVHHGLIESKIELNRCVMYIDDLTIILNDSANLVADINRLIGCFKKRGLFINPKKCSILTDEDVIKKLYKSLDMEFVTRQKYLGVNLRIGTYNTVIADARIYKFNKSNISIPKFVNICIKRRIYEGAILAKVRYSCMMIALKEKVERQYFWQNLMYIYKQDYFKLSYIQLILISHNWFRLFFDLNDFKYIQNKCKDIPMMENRIEFANGFFLERIKCGIKQIDDRLKGFSVEIDDPLYWNVSLCFIKSLVNAIFISIKKTMVKNWKQEKEMQNIKLIEDVEVWFQDRLFFNFKIIQNLVLRHMVENITWCSFILCVFSQVNSRIRCKKSEEVDILSEFKVINIFIWGDKDVDRISWFKIFYMKMDEYLKNIREFITQYKDQYRDFMKLNVILEYISSNDIWRNKSIKDLVYILNLRLSLNDYISNTCANIILEDMDEYYEEVSVVPEDLDHVIAVDGSFNDKKNLIGAGIYVRFFEFNDIKEEFLYSSIKSNYEGRNIVGEAFACIKALEIAIDKGWKQVNIVFDYIGLAYWYLNIWSCNVRLASAYKHAIKLLSNKIAIKWLKVKSHTSVKVNDYADILAKVGASVMSPNYNHLEVDQSKWL